MVPSAVTSQIRYDYTYFHGSSNYKNYDSLGMRISRLFFHKKVLSLIESHMHEKGGNLLDLGCATGSFVKAAANRGFFSIGCDVSEYTVKEARKRYPDLKIFNADIEKKLNIPDKTFDVITALDVLEHCKKLDRVLSESRRLLKDNGLFVVSVPDSDILPKEKDKDPTHVWHLNMEEWEKVFDKAGFKILTSCTYPGILRRIKPLWCKPIFVMRKLTPSVQTAHSCKARGCAP